MVDIKQILEEAKYIIKGHTVEETAIYFNCSIRTIQNHINTKLKTLAQTNEEYKKIYDELKESQKILSKEKMILGGSIGAKNATWTTEECEKIARFVILYDLSIRGAAKTLKIIDESYEDIPKSTLYDRLKKGIKDKNLLFEFQNHMDKNRTK